MPRELQIPFKGRLPTVHTPNSVKAAREIAPDPERERLIREHDDLRARLRAIEAEIEGMNL